MAAKIRLKKVGRRGQPSYRVVVLDGRKPRDAKVVADLGHYDPKTNPATFEVDGDAALEWLLKGAKATKAARDILSKAGVMAAWDAAKRGVAVAIEAKELKPTSKPKKSKAKADDGAVGADDETAGAGEEPTAADAETSVPVGQLDEASVEAGETPVEAEQASETKAEAEAEEEPVEPEAEPAAADEEASEDEPAGDADEDDGEDEKETA
jgi:small subunit ribosomal protein S16